MLVNGRRGGRLRLGIWVGVLVLAGVASLSVVGIQPASSRSLEPPTKVRICHATASHSNPYVSDEPAIANNGDLEGGHLNHKGPIFPAADWGDIVPPYDYVDNSGVTQTFPGYNWSPEGQAIYQLGCSLPREPLTPILECVAPETNQRFLAHFGYQNPNSDPVVPPPAENTFVPGPADRGQPTIFQPGRAQDAFQVEFDGSALTWKLTGNQVTASADSKSCAGEGKGASVTIVKVLNPTGDPGRFNLEIDGKTAGGASAVGGGGTTGTIAVSPQDHTVGESAADGTNLADYTVQIVCASGGMVVAGAASSSVSVPIQRGDDVVCTITNTRRSDVTPPALKALVPVLECVVFRGVTPEQAVWGYANNNNFAVPAPIGTANGFAPEPVDRGQPTQFEPGSWPAVFQTAFGTADTLTWTLAGQTATASSASTHCTAIIELRKVVAPAGDPGVFNLLLNGQVLASGGNGTTAGPYTVGPGEGTVSETAGPGTNLSDYQSTVTCTRNGTVEVTVTGTKVDGALANGDFAVCTFTNVRITTPPTPTPPEAPTPPTPPTQPDPPPLPPTPLPPAPLVDLTIEKSAEPTTVPLGRKISWTVRVTNASKVAAADVNVIKLTERAYRTKPISVTPSQGTCSLTSCDLGRIGPGASATITAVTLATQIGEILNVVRVGSEEPESDYLNNTASNIVRVVGRSKPPPKAVCRTLGAAPKLLRAGTTSVVLTTARERFGAPVPGVTVHVRGPGVSGQAKTNSRGIARFTVTPTAPGFVTFRGAQRTHAAAGPVCATYLAGLAAKPESVTG